jgi:hypothetical protein
VPKIHYFNDYNGIRNYSENVKYYDDCNLFFSIDPQGGRFSGEENITFFEQKSLILPQGADEE